MTGPADSDLWFPTAPGPVRAVPAAQRGSLRGRRVVTGTPGRGWRCDLRADDPVEQDGRAFVPVLAEHDWYRAELDDTDVFAPLVPVERVWVEQPDAAAGSAEPPANLLARLVTLDAPPLRIPVPARDMPALTGRRVVVVSPETVRRDVRAASEPYENDDGTICLSVCAEPDWYRWAFAGRPADCTEVPVYLVWAE
ncbi:hypothetical protein [Actinocatenispora sera]|uniref:Uncharacterized protein n=1 Tax=Actinocatenispora sera TaxID=390989 RepID=A0A810KUY8_9ACTN|nr:hypothetical protein [Actinocatenispora sera]BCJ26485.1 hypothetical protein Asera_05930 [Actinocatenispora sera]